MAVPDLVPVDSTAVEAVGYDATDHVLYVRFTGGRTYRYQGVTPEQHRGLLAAESIGGYVNEEIKPNHPYEPVDG